jgi:hypothetical protein
MKKNRILKNYMILIIILMFTMVGCATEGKIVQRYGIGYKTYTAYTRQSKYPATLFVEKFKDEITFETDFCARKFLEQLFVDNLAEGITNAIKKDLASSNLFQGVYDIESTNTYILRGIVRKFGHGERSGVTVRFDALVEIECELIESKTSTRIWAGSVKGSRILQGKTILHADEAKALNDALEDAGAQLKEQIDSTLFKIYK